MYWLLIETVFCTAQKHVSQKIKYDLTISDAYRIADFQISRVEIIHWFYNDIFLLSSLLIIPKFCLRSYKKKKKMIKKKLVNSNFHYFLMVLKCLKILSSPLWITRVYIFHTLRHDHNFEFIYDCRTNFSYDEKRFVPSCSRPREKCPMTSVYFGQYFVVTRIKFLGIYLM